MPAPTRGGNARLAARVAPRVGPRPPDSPRVRLGNAASRSESARKKARLGRRKARLGPKKTRVGAFLTRVGVLRRRSDIYQLDFPDSHSGRPDSAREWGRVGRGAPAHIYPDT